MEQFVRLKLILTRRHCRNLKSYYLINSKLSINTIRTSAALAWLIKIWIWVKHEHWFIFNTVWNPLLRKPDLLGQGQIFISQYSSFWQYHWLDLVCDLVPPAGTTYNVCLSTTSRTPKNAQLRLLLNLLCRLWILLLF